MALMKAAQRHEFFRRMQELNPHPKSDLEYSTPFELLVAVILSAQGLSFAVASNLAKFVVGKLILEGRVRRGYIGVGAQAVPLPAKWLNALEVNTKGGVQIQTVESGGPAEKAGILPGDVLMQFEGKPVDSIDLLHKALGEETIGRRISVWLLRDGGLKSLDVVPGEMK